MQMVVVYNLPTTDEIAAIIPGDGSEERSDHRDIVLRLTGGGLKTHQPPTSKLFNSSLHNASFLGVKRVIT